MFYIYILRSLKTAKYYVGHSDDIVQRVDEHNRGLSGYTKSGRPWELAYTEQYETRSAAMKREIEIKGRKSRKYIATLIKSVRLQVRVESVPSNVI
ncbi:MAG: GIY-YIG nuclease family protein [Ignavibacteriales bacterium]|nr:GIY-YIG nuclease family protein [Ignavibacteriales bacterium]